MPRHIEAGVCALFTPVREHPGKNSSGEQKDDLAVWAYSRGDSRAQGLFCHHDHSLRFVAHLLLLLSSEVSQW